MKSLFVLLAGILLASSSFSQSLWINDPQNWRGGVGTIEETKIIYQPCGLFMKVDWEITFSARGLQEFTNKDTVEVVYNFNLPKGTIVNDSWLWFGDTILKAMILDRWSASQVYENIVNRRRDPSVLYKNGNTNYELRIFPMAAKESRKVKISFLTPANWKMNKVTSYFVSENLLVSKNPIQKIEVFADVSPEWGIPVITGEQDIVLEPITCCEHGNGAEMDFNQLKYGQEFVVNSPLTDGFYLGFFENNGENFYQLALNPSEGMDIRKSQKVLFLIDYQKENSNLSQAELLKLFAREMTSLLNEKDSFNILYYDFELQKASETWVPGDSASIYQAIENLGENPFVSYSNLASLLASGIEFAQQEEGSKIVLLANSDRIDDVEAANALIEDLMKLMEPVLPIYIGDYQTTNYRYYYVKNYNYRGNEYFYQNLAKLTGGDFVHSFDGLSFSECLNKIYLLATSEPGLIDIHTTLENGFCYGRYNLSQVAENPLSSMFLQVGKYSGEFPFEVEISGIYDDEIFSRKLSISKEDAVKSDSLLASFWHGKEILEMESSGNSYSFINEIIDKSIENRILSNYTSFLCLEPGMMDQLENIEDNQIFTRGWENEIDGGIIISAEKPKTRLTEINAYPNPFTERINIEIQLAETVSVENAQLEIYDLFGKRIKVFSVEEFNGDSEIRIIWDATDNSGKVVTKGTYLFICTTPERRISKKLVLM